jgi:hypothetical protein
VAVSHFIPEVACSNTALVTGNHEQIVVVFFIKEMVHGESKETMN